MTDGLRNLCDTHVHFYDRRWPVAPGAVLTPADASVADYRAVQDIVWASNWPHPGQVDPPSAAVLASLIERWLPTVELRRRILVDNPARLYDF